MELRDILLVLHIAGAGTWLGANIVQAVAPSMAAKQGPAAAAGWCGSQRGFSLSLHAGSHRHPGNRDLDGPDRRCLRVDHPPS